MEKQKRIRKNKLQRWTVLLTFLFITCFATGMTVSAQEDPVGEAKQGIVEIYSGFTTDDGTFHKLKNASGFVICNQEDSAYVVTTYDTLKSSEKKKKKYCKTNKLNAEGYSLNDTIQVVVKGDVTVTANILTESEQQNYAVLQIDSSLSERTALKLGSTADLITGNSVYALGFDANAGKDDEETNRHTEFAALDVKISEGRLQDTGANKNGILYLQHSAAVHAGNTGGPLLDENGYVVGINNVSVNEEGVMEYYSLPVDELREILDNFGIMYGSLEKDTSMVGFEALVKECEQLAADKQYKSKSQQALLQAIENAKDITASENPGDDEIQTAIEQLEAGKSQLVLKMKTTRKIMIVLAAVIACMAVILIRLMLWKKDAKDSRIIMEDMKKVEMSLNTSGKKAMTGSKEGSDLSEITGAHQSMAAGYKKENDNEVKKTVQETMQETVKEKNRIVREDEEEKTVLLGTADLSKVRSEDQAFMNRKVKASIRCIRTGQTVLIDKPQIQIGKKENINDLAINDNSAVSRKHAVITWDDDIYYIEDLGSANGTTVNGAKVEPENPVRLEHGDSILLANEKILFKVEEENQGKEG